MKKRTAAFLVLFVLGVSPQAKNKISDSVHIEKAGTLSAIVTKDKIFSDSLLILSGNLNESDFRYIRILAGKARKVSSLDLSTAGIYKIPDYALSGSSSLTSVVLPHAVSSIQYNAFSLCTRLTSVTFGPNVSAIAPYAFSGCTALTKISIPEKVTILSTGTFSGCTALTSITLPAALATIQSGAFAGCKALKEIHCKSQTPPEVADNAFVYVNKSTCKLFVPRRSLASYKKDAKWSGFLTIVEEK